MMKKQRNFDRQMWAVRNLEHVPTHNPDLYISEFRVQEFSGRILYVERAYRDPKWHGNFAAHDTFTVGVRGAVKLIRSEMY